MFLKKHYQEKNKEKMLFSQRIGKSKVKTELEKEGLGPELINSLWTMFMEGIIDEKINEGIKYPERYNEITKFFRSVWMHFFKYPIDNLPIADYGYNNRQVDVDQALNYVRKWFYKAEWYHVLDFIEFWSQEDNLGTFQILCNIYFKREFSAYRFIDGNLVEINSKEEILEIERALNISDKFKSVKVHLKRSLELISDKKNPDYRNSIKESISAVESICKIIINDDKTTLGKALGEIEKKHKIPGSLKSAFSALYGFTSDEAGIRHSLLDKGINVEIEEARFMLITCSAFINYLINKI
jgi:hypothetical protein